MSPYRKFWKHLGRVQVTVHTKHLWARRAISVKLSTAQLLRQLVQSRLQQFAWPTPHLIKQFYIWTFLQNQHLLVKNQNTESERMYFANKTAENKKDSVSSRCTKQRRHQGPQHLLPEWQLRVLQVQLQRLLVCALVGTKPVATSLRAQLRTEIWEWECKRLDSRRSDTCPAF